MSLDRHSIELGAYLLLAVAGGALIARRLPAWPWVARGAEWLAHPWGPAAAIAAVTVLFHWWQWGSLDAVPVVHDEAAYVLQAEIFARGMWAAPSPPLPRFFEQFHVFVEPVLAPKYPPGHGILLVPGVLFGLPGLIPVVMNGLIGMLLFLLARRLATPAVGLLTWLVWLVAPGSLSFRVSYYSEVSTALLILAASWGLLEWRERDQRWWLVIVSVAVAWGAVTRPLTMLAFAIPIAVVVLIRAWRDRRWSHVVLAAAAGLPVLGLLPLQNVNVTGEWTLSPYRHYSDVYFPFDVPGFGLKTGPAQRDLPADMAGFYGAFGPVHERHTVERIPLTLLERVSTVLRTTWGAFWLGMGAAFLVGLVRLTREGWFALLSGALLFVAYLVFAHPPGWYLYYLEAQQIVAFVTALGMWRMGRWILGVGNKAVNEGARSRREAAMVLVAVLFLAPFSARSVAALREGGRSLGAYQTAFRDLLAQVPGRILVFVRYAPSHNLHFSLITNVPDIDEAHAVMAYDRGTENPELLAHFPDRVPYLFDEASGRLVAMDGETGAVDDPALRPGGESSP